MTNKANSSQAICPNCLIGFLVYLKKKYFKNFAVIFVEDLVFLFKLLVDTIDGKTGNLYEIPREKNLQKDAEKTLKSKC